MEIHKVKIVKAIRKKWGTIRCWCDNQTPPIPVQSFYKFLDGKWGTRADTDNAGKTSKRYYEALEKSGILEKVTA